MTSIVTFKSTSTGPDGYSTKKNFMGCGAIAVVKERQAREDFANGVSYPPYEENGKADGAVTGSLLGHLLQNYHAGKPDPVRAEFHWEGHGSMEKTHPKTCAEVRRLYDWYTSTHTENHWGKFVGQEVWCEVPAELFGERVTCAIDLVTEEDGGEILSDFKWLAREEKTVWEEYSLTHQLFFYAIAREIQTGKPVKRIQYLTGFKRKENPAVVPQVYDITDEYRIRWLKNFMETVQAKRLAARPEPSPSNCLAYGRACQFLLQGKCGLL